MRRLISLSSLLLLAFLFAPVQAHAATIVIFGTNTGTDATATAEVTLTGTTFNFSLTNTSPFAAAITGVGLDLFAGDSVGNTGLNGFTGDPAVVGGFTFSDGNLGNVPGFNPTVLDFGFLTGNNFSGGNVSDGIAPGDTLSFTVIGAFPGLTDAEIAAALFVRFQQVSERGRLSDVGTGVINPTPIPEPASMLLLGTGLAAVAARRRLRKREVV